MTGKVAKSNEGVKLYPDQRAAILQSLDKMMVTTYDPDIIDAFEKLDYGDSDSLAKIKKAPLLPCKCFEKTINGQRADVMAHALTFDDIFKKCKIEGKPNVIKLRAREYIEDFFQQIQAKNVIKSFKINFAF